MNAARGQKPAVGDDFVDDVDETMVNPAQRPKPKRLTLDVAPDLHKRLKGTTGERGTTILGELTEMMEARYRGGRWPDDVVEQVRAQIAAEQSTTDQPPAGVRRRGKA